MWRRSFRCRRCRLSCCGRKGRKSTRLWAQRRTSSRRRLRNIDRDLSSVILFIQLFIFLSKVKRILKQSLNLLYLAVVL
uniref:Uncharacterized protein n=1 Tax=Glycine max TaxID=3847 RepID=C6T4J4_SOYBN|nr:unknown [Glycine max]